jgi:hypothetical protein
MKSLKAYSARGYNRSFIRLTGVLLCLLFSMTVIGGLAEAKKKTKKPPPPPPSDLPGHVNYLARQLYGLHLDESGQITAEIQKLVLDALEKWAADRAPTDVEMRRQFEADFALLHYPLMGQPAVDNHPWKGGVITLAGYTLGWSDFDRVNTVAVFDSREGKTRLVTVTNFVPRTDLHYEFIDPLAGVDDLRFFIWGYRLGKSQPRLTAILYSFDGQALKSLWETHDVFDGKMDVDKDKVVIRYLKEDEYVRETQQRRKPPRHEATYRLTPAGMEIVSDRDIPF